METKKQFCQDLYDVLCENTQYLDIWDFLYKYRPEGAEVDCDKCEITYGEYKIKIM